MTALSYQIGLRNVSANTDARRREQAPAKTLERTISSVDASVVRHAKKSNYLEGKPQGRQKHQACFCFVFQIVLHSHQQKMGEKSNMGEKSCFYFSWRLRFQKPAASIYSEIEANDLLLQGMEETK